MGTNVASLGKASATLLALVWAFASVAAHMSLEVSQLGEGEVASREVTDIWLVASVSPSVNVQMGLLREALVTAGSVAHVSLDLGLDWCGSASLVAVFRDWRHAGGQWLGSLCLGKFVGLSLDSLHKFVNLGFKVNFVLGVEGLVRCDGLGKGRDLA